MSTNQQPVSKVPSTTATTAPVTNGDSKVSISKPLSSQPKKSDSEVEDEEEVEYEEEEVEVDEEYDEDYEIEEVEVDDDGEEDLEEPTEADAEELEDDDVTNDEFDRVGSKIDELLAKTGTLQSSLNGSASLASKVIAETATKPEPAKIPEIPAVKIVQSPVKPTKVVEVEEEVEDEEGVEYVYEDEEEVEEEPKKVPEKAETKPEEEPVKVVPQIVFKPKVSEKVLEEEEEEELEDEEVEYVYEDEEEEEEAPPAGNLLRHASNNWNICDLKDDAEICLQTQDGSFNNKVVETMPISELDQSESKQLEASQPISNVIRPVVIQSEEEEEDIEEIEIALEEGMEEDEDDDDEVDEQMPDNLLRDPSSSINKSPMMDHYQIDLPPMSPSPTPNSATSPGSPGFPSGLTTGGDQQKHRQSRSPSPSPGRRSLSPASQILSRVRNLVLLGQLAPLQQLLDSTPNFFIDAILKAGWTALMYGSYRGYPAIVDFCLKRDSDPNYHKEFFTSLMAVCTSVSADESQLLLCMKLLLGYGARVNAVDKFGCSPLHYAARFGRAQLIRCLLSYGANLNHTNQNGWSALHWAAAENQTDAIGELLDQNIDVHLKTTNPDAMTASELAAMKKNFEVAEALGEMEQEDLIAKQQQQLSKPEPKSESVGGGSSIDDDEKQFKLKQDKIDSIISQAFESAGNRFTKIQEEDEDEVEAAEAEAEAEEVEVKVKVEQEEVKESEQCKMEQISQSSSQPEQSPLTNNSNISEFKEQEEEVLNRPRFAAKLESDPMSDIVAQLELPPESDALWCRDSIQLDQSPIASPSFFATTTGHLVLTCILFVLLKFLYSILFGQSVTDVK